MTNKINIKVTQEQFENWVEFLAERVKKKMICPYCQESRIAKVGKIPTVKEGMKQRYQCRECGRTFYERSQYKDKEEQ